MGLKTGIRVPKETSITDLVPQEHCGPAAVAPVLQTRKEGRMWNCILSAASQSSPHVLASWHTCFLLHNWSSLLETASTTQSHPQLCLILLRALKNLYVSMHSFGKGLSRSSFGPGMMLVPVIRNNQKRWGGCPGRYRRAGTPCPTPDLWLQH